jgi:hypothetical protein
VASVDVYGITAPSALPAPVIVQVVPASGGKATITLRFDLLGGDPAGYNIYYGPNEADAFDFLYLTGAVAPASYPVYDMDVTTEVLLAGTYYFGATVNDSGSGVTAHSNVVSCVIDATAPAVPTIESGGTL